jgi:hypothetical protein
MLQDFVKPQYTLDQEKHNREEDMAQAFLEESGLEGVDANYLRKQILSAEEAIAAKTEQLEDIRIRKSRKTDWDEYIDAPRRWGTPLHHSEIISKLRRVIPNLYVDDGMQRNTLSLYIWDGTHPFESKVGGTVFLGWIHYGYNPEYEIDLVNDVGIAIGQKRGWRTILIRLICRRDAKTFVPKSLITEQQAQELFGDPTNGPTASNYRMHLYRFRNTTPERAKMEHELMEAAQRYQYC